MDDLVVYEQGEKEREGVVAVEELVWFVEELELEELITLVVKAPIPYKNSNIIWSESYALTHSTLGVAFIYIIRLVT